MANNTNFASKKSSGSSSVEKSTHSTRGSTSPSTLSSGPKGSPLRSGFRPAGSMAELMAKAGSSVQVLQKGQSVSGTIKKLTPQEILMDIGAKGDALVIEFDKQNLENLLSNLKVGDKVGATVISPESEEGFPVVSLRRTLDDIIFKKFEDLALGDEAFEVKVQEATRGGYFALTPEGIRGFLPSSQVLSGETLNSGAKIKVKILEYDRSKKRVVFSQKATAYVTNVDFIKSLVGKTEVIDAQVTEVVPYGLFVKISAKGGSAAGGQKGENLIEGFVHISEVSHERVENLGVSYKAGDKIKAQVMEIDTANRRVNLSIKKTKLDVFASVREKYKAEDKIRGKVAEVKSRGITLRILSGQAQDVETGINGFIPSDKIPHFAPIESGLSRGKPFDTAQGKPSGYNVGDTVECEVVDFDDRRRRLILSPILKAVPIGYR